MTAEKDVAAGSLVEANAALHRAFGPWVQGEIVGARTIGDVVMALAADNTEANNDGELPQ